jgi:alkanesulfonate monooxygenase SsuD/methylene tetrahydromethanopterin reductase-like flavin-dependent oxidoreductase (luciferase family)
VTQRLKLGTSVLDALFHSPVVLGRQLATLDQLSGGRLIVGLGQGWSDDEFQVVNVPPKRKGAGFDDFLQALFAVWGPDPVSYDGRFYSIPSSEIGPKPVQQPLPVVIGGMTPAAIARAGKLGLALNPVLFGFEMLEQGLQAYRAAATEAGHNADSLSVVVRGNLYLGGDRVEGMPLSGSVENGQEDVRRLADLGVDQLFVDFYLMTGTPIDRQLEILQALMAAAS